ncbi:neuraminidase-like domain-containing protein [Pseudomonas batumici]|uniref:Insecticidal toxin protein n=1 Tax=Pseudomonas batumici TaxID=226910 RepID=A0A0C2IDT4_9PSED|nr:neuraminidase-like domain-containing protein [Pseudomonas batumici]KIH85085.1 hypothetical protein UCMB321_1073 [Pseudomonas batumici]
MTLSIEKQLNETLRDVQVAYYLDQVVANDPVLQQLGLSDKLKTANDLYEFLLLDVQVSQEVETSWVASAIASLQQYINGVLMGMEPGYENKTLAEHQIVEWRDQQCQYPLWAANQQLAYYPSIYIEPSLRMKKSGYFRQLENDINQNKIHLDTTQEAVKHYLASFEEVANLTIINGYITDDDFANGTYYFIGKSRAENKYYWRSVDMSQRSYVSGTNGPKHDYPQPGAWSDWMSADLGISETTVEKTIRPVFFNNRLFVVWVDVLHLAERTEMKEKEPIDKDSPEVETSSFKRTELHLNLSYKKYDNSWSAPLCYIIATSEADSFPLGEDLNGVLETIAIQDTSSTPDALFIAMYAGYTPNTESSGSDGSKDTYAFLKTANVDKNFNRHLLFPSAGKVGVAQSEPGDKRPHVLKVARMFAYDNRNKFQFTLPTFQISVKEVKSSSPHSAESSWNFKNLQAMVSNVSSADVTYDRTKSEISMVSKITSDVVSGKHRQATLRFVYLGTFHYFTLILRIGDENTDPNFQTLQAGSKIINLRNQYYTREDNFSFELYRNDTDSRKDFLVDNKAQGKIKLPPIPVNDDGYSLEGKFIRKAAIDWLFSVSSERSIIVESDNGTLPNTSAVLRHVVELVDELPKKYYQHQVSRPKSVLTPTPVNLSSESVWLASREYEETLIAPDTLSIKVKIDPETLLPDWPVEWPANSKVIPFNHGIFVRSVTPGGPLLGGGHKHVTVELKLETSSGGTLKSPGMGTRDSPTLGIAEFIDFRGSDVAFSDGSTAVARKPIRMNTLFARTLIEKANIALENLLSWETQQQEEPPLEPPSTDNKMDFNGANGLYFWELFLHLPFMVAHRLNLEQQFDASEYWLSFIFDPSRRSDSSGRPAYWNVRPLVGSSTRNLDYAVRAPQDPDGIASSNPIHYRKAIYSFYLKNLLDRGDNAYRQLTPDSLAEAKLWYVRVLDLLGPRPDVNLIDPWTPITLLTLADSSSQGLRDYERRLVAQDEERRVSAEDNDGVSLILFNEPPLELRTFTPDPNVQSVDSDFLRVPMNFKLVELWDTAESRLHNLRNNRTLDGKPLLLPLFAAPLDPRALLAAYGQGGGGGGGGRLIATDIAPYRFSIMHRSASSAVDSLIQFGQTLLSLIERKEQAEFLELQHQQAWEFAEYAILLQKQAQKIEAESRNALKASRNIVERRRAFYQKLSDEVVSAGEIAAGVEHLLGRALDGAAAVADSVAAALKPVPGDASAIAGLIAGMAAGPTIGMGVGGVEVEGVVEVVARSLRGGAALSHATGEALDRVEGYRRRHEEWMLARDQAVLEIAQIEAQLKVLDEQNEATRLQLLQAEAALEQARVSHAFLSKRFSNTQLYQWLIGQFATFYYQMYDATLSLCLAAQAGWQYEIADFVTTFIQTGGWNDSYRGLGAGESLKVNLLRMESEYLKRHERKLEMTKTLSLRELNAKDPTSTINLPWEDLQDRLEEDGSVAFELTQALFDNDYPGHYLRRIKRISVSLPVLLGPYEDIRAELTQIYSKVQLSATVDAVVRENLRASQQIALSGGLNDDGMFVLNFDDERYLPFEGTGAVSRWALVFPRPDLQREALKSLTDIIVHVQYTAKS